MLHSSIGLSSEEVRRVVSPVVAGPAFMLATVSSASVVWSSCVRQNSRGSRIGRPLGCVIGSTLVLRM